MVDEGDLYYPYDLNPAYPYEYYPYYDYEYGVNFAQDYYEPIYVQNYRPFIGEPMQHSPYFNMYQTPAAQMNSRSKEQVNTMMQQFLDENGQVDIQKMLQTVGQLADTVQQVSPVIRQLNDLIRTFRTS